MAPPQWPRVPSTSEARGPSRWESRLGPRRRAQPQRRGQLRALPPAVRPRPRALQVGWLGRRPVAAVAARPDSRTVVGPRGKRQRASVSATRRRARQLLHNTRAAFPRAESIRQVSGKLGPKGGAHAIFCFQRFLQPLPRGRVSRRAEGAGRGLRVTPRARPALGFDPLLLAGQGLSAWAGATTLAVACSSAQPNASEGAR